MKAILKLLLLTGLALCTSPVSAQISNGSFETPVVPNGSFTNFAGGSTLISGWTVVGIDVAIVNSNFTSSGITFQAQSGNQWLDLTGFNSNSPTNGVTQSVTTEIGTTYQLSFYVGSTSGGSFSPATVDLSINGGSRVSFFNPNAPTTMLDWQLFTPTFLATTTSTSITFFNGSASNNNSTGLDNVSLTVAAVPEPATILFAAIGVAGLGMVAWRKKRRTRRKQATSQT